MGTAKTYKIPAKLGACADLLYQLKDEKSKAQKVVDAIEAHMSALKEHLIEKLPKEEAAKGVIGQLAKVTVSSENKPVPDPDNWPKFCAYMAETESWDMIQRRVNEKAVNERIADGVKVSTMGLQLIEVHKVSVTKV